MKVKDILQKLDLQINKRREQLSTSEYNLKRAEDNLSENSILINQLEANNPNLQQRFRMFQEMRLYSRDLLECLNEKV